MVTPLIPTYVTICKDRLLLQGKMKKERTSTKPEIKKEISFYTIFKRNCTFYRKGNHLNICYIYVSNKKNLF